MFDLHRRESMGFKRNGALVVILPILGLVAAEGKAQEAVDPMLGAHVYASEGDE